jgi:hypothetical protein
MPMTRLMFWIVVLIFITTPIGSFQASMKSIMDREVTASNHGPQGNKAGNTYGLTAAAEPRPILALQVAGRFSYPETVRKR